MGMGVGGQAGRGYVGVREGRQAWVHGRKGMCVCMHRHESGRVRR